VTDKIYPLEFEFVDYTKKLSFREYLETVRTGGNYYET
jgi:hypothetical protein